MTRKQSTERLWPPEEKKVVKERPAKLFSVPQSLEEEEAQFSLDAEAVARALAPSLNKKCPACPACPQASIAPAASSPHGQGRHLNVREGILLILVAVLALSAFVCALISSLIASNSSRAIIKLEQLLHHSSV